MNKCFYSKSNFLTHVSFLLSIHVVSESILVNINSQTKNIRVGSSSFSSFEGKESVVTFRYIRSLNSIYCNNSCENKVIECENGGYKHPNICYKCKCPFPFNGIRCEIMESHKSDDCGNGTLTGTTNAS
uniref:EGF-like domain-containing protein n=1 Tax=Parastrongyloides trichosuri TaxID=131310 RepID=A0A0N5A0Q7_PARTI